MCQAVLVTSSPPLKSHFQELTHWGSGTPNVQIWLGILTVEDLVTVLSQYYLLVFFKTKERNKYAEGFMRLSNSSFIILAKYFYK